MRFLHSFSIFISFILIFSSNMVFADQKDCDSNAVHCAYISGSPDGRYVSIKIKGKSSPGICSDNHSFFEVLPSQAPKLLGNNSVTYYICSDPTAKNCEKVSVDNFTISGSKKQGYTAAPRYFKVDLSAFKDKYQKCDQPRSKVDLTEYF